MSWLALDIGGANLKAADGRGWARTVPFPLWRDPHGLSAALSSLMESAPAADRICLTMTGELCDCFRTKKEGVDHILASVQQVSGGREIWVYLVDGRLVRVQEARNLPTLVAASNWHALARFACRFVAERPGLLLDIGSTTTDIIPLVGGEPRPVGLNDTDRLLAGELIYTGVVRTPICAITDRLPWGGTDCPVAAEWFATAADAYVLLDKLPEDAHATWTPDGRPLSKEFCRERLARMICSDATVFTMQDAQRVAVAVRSAQFDRIAKGVRQVIGQMPEPPVEAVVSGCGAFVAEEVVHRVLPRIHLISLAEHLGPAASVAAPAHALAVLASEIHGRLF